MSSPADLITVSSDLAAGDLYDALTMAVSHARSTTCMVELALSDSNEEGMMVIAPHVLATTLHGVETHLAAVEALATRLLESREGAQ